MSPSNISVQGDQLFDVRIVERYGRSRTLAEFHKVTKPEALVMLGAAFVASYCQRGERVWVQPRVQVRLRPGSVWKDQRFEITGKASHAFINFLKTNPVQGPAFKRAFCTDAEQDAESRSLSERAG